MFGRVIHCALLIALALLPSGAGGWPEATNKYAYAQANPTSYADPTGNFAVSLHTLMIGVIGEKAPVNDEE